MTTYTTIPNSAIDQDSPVTQTLMQALRDNPVAIAEGAVGAPRIQTAALAPPAAGTSHLIMRLQEATVDSGKDRSTYLDVGYNDRYSAGAHLGVTCLVSGTITAYFEHRHATATSYVRILKNGSQVAEWSNTSISFAARSLDISVNVGDAIVFQQRASGGSDIYAEWRYLRIYSNNPDFAVA